MGAKLNKSLWAKVWICNLSTLSAQNSRVSTLNVESITEAPFIFTPSLVQGIPGTVIFFGNIWPKSAPEAKMAGRPSSLNIFVLKSTDLSICSRGGGARSEKNFLKNEIQHGFADHHWWVSLQSGCLFGAVSACSHLQSPQGEAQSVWFPIGPDNSPMSLWGCSAHAKKVLQQLKKVFSLSSGVYLSSS